MNPRKSVIVVALALLMAGAVTVTTINIGTVSNIASARTATDFSNATVKTAAAAFSPGSSTACLLYVDVTSITGTTPTLVARLRWQPTSTAQAAIMCATASITAVGGYTCVPSPDTPLQIDGFSIESTTGGTVTDLDYTAYISCLR